MARKKKSSGFSYRGHTKEDVQRGQQATSGVRDPMFNVSAPVFSPKAGEKYRLRILPVPADELDGDPNYVNFAYKLSIHYGVGPDNRQYLNLADMKNERDPIAELRQKLMQRGDAEEASELRPTQRYLMWVIDRKEEDKGPQLWACPKSAFQAILDLMWDEDEGEDATMPLDHPDEGYDIVFSREAGESRYSKYINFKTSKSPKPISDDAEQQEKWLEFVSEHALAGSLKFYEYEHISKQLMGDYDESSDEDDDEEPSPVSRQSGKSSSKTKETSTDEDEEDSDGEDEEDGEEDSDGEDEDEDEDEEVDEDEEDGEEDSDGEDEDEDEEDSDGEDDEDEDDEDEDDEDEDDEDLPDPPKPRGGAKKAPKKKAAKKAAAKKAPAKRTKRK